MSELRVVLFVSRNKDNKDVAGFKERKLPFLTSKTDEETLDEFEDFVKKGVVGEMSRFYASVNTRDEDKLYKALLHYLIDNPNVKLQSITGKVASLASKPENRKTKKFLLDCDVEKNELHSILEYLMNMTNTEVFEVYETVNGYGIITSGFDTRELLEKFPNVELKRDGQKLIYYKTRV